jgi:neurofilament heavy polypeptide
MEREPHRPNYDELKKAHGADPERADNQSGRTESQASESEPTRPDKIRRPSPGWTDRGDMPSQQDSAREQAKLNNERLQQKTPAGNDKQKAQQPEQPKPEPTPEQPTPPEKNQADWRRLLNDPDYRRQVEATPAREVKEPQRQQTQEASQQARPGDQPEKKAEEKEVDWRRVLTDPDYRREVKQREAGQEKVAQQERQHGEQRVPSGRDR